MEEGGAGEVPVSRCVADVVLADGRVLEIQTGRLGKIRGKLAALLEQRPVRLAFPIADEEYLVVYDAKGRHVLYRRRSPKRGTVLSLLDELVGVAGLLAHPRFAVEALLTRFVHRELAAALGAPLGQARKLSYCLRAAGVLRVGARHDLSAYRFIGCDAGPPVVH